MIANGQKENFAMARFISSAALTVLGLATSACSTDQAGGNPQFWSNRSMYSENQPVVQRTDYVFDVSTNGDGVSEAELGRLADWFESLSLRYGDRIAVDAPYGSGGIRRDIGRLTASYGLLLSDGAPVTAGSVRPGYARVVLSRSTASVPGCPNWRQRELSGAPISTESNFGCATNANIAAMVANPNDLVLGQEGTISGDAATASKAIKQYRDAKPTGADGLQQVNTKGSN
jgi:pilus assembly protein CpaD